MSLTFPISLPSTPGFRSCEIVDDGNVGLAVSPFTGEQQVYAWPMQLLRFRVELPAMKEPNIGIWSAFFMSLNGPAGKFYLGDSLRKTPRGTIAGSPTVDSGAVAGSTTLPITGGTGAFAVGDWLQVSSGSTSRLHRVLKVNAGSVDVFPVLRSAYAAATAITYTNPKGVFRLAARVPVAADSRKLASGISFAAFEAL
jgi:hypothetical protein